MFSSERERRRRRRENEAIGYAAIVGILVLLSLLVSALYYVVGLVSVGSFAFPAFFGLLFWSNAAPPRRYPFKAVAIVTAIDLVLMVALWAIYPAATISFGISPVEIPFILPTWVGLGNLIAGLYLLRQFRKGHTPASPRRYLIAPHLIAVALCLVVGLWLCHNVNAAKVKQIAAEFELEQRQKAADAKHWNEGFTRQVKLFEQDLAEKLPRCDRWTRYGYKCPLPYYPAAPTQLPDAERRQYYDRCVPQMQKRNKVAEHKRTAEEFCAQQTGLAR
jgi:hypothetical protein